MKQVSDSIWTEVQRLFELKQHTQIFYRKVHRAYLELGAFVELVPGFDALARPDAIWGLEGRSLTEVLLPGTVVAVRFISLDQRLRRASISITVDATGEVANGAIIPSCANSIDERGALDYIRSFVREAPAHGSLLGELNRRFAIPRPVSVWLRRHPEFFSFPPTNPYAPGHPCFGFRARLEDPDYWRGFVSSTAAHQVVPTVSSVVSEADFCVQKNSNVRPSILVDGSNIFRTCVDGVEGGGILLCRTLRALKLTGYRTQIFFDANFRYEANEHHDHVALDLLQQIKQKTPDRLCVVPAGIRADDFIVTLANKRGYDIVSNDRYEQFFECFPWLNSKRMEQIGQRRRVHPFVVHKGVLMFPSLTHIGYDIQKDLDPSIPLL